LKKNNLYNNIKSSICERLYQKGSSDLQITNNELNKVKNELNDLIIDKDNIEI